MSKFCENCGKELESGAKFCAGCGSKVTEEKKEEKKEEVVKAEPVKTEPVTNKQGGNIFGILSLCFYFGTYFLYMFMYWVIAKLNINISFFNHFSTVLGTLPLAGIVLMIIGRVKYPNNKFLKVAMWIIVGAAIATVIAAAIIIITCYISCINTDWSGCS